jgi:hypothetical protein
MILDDRSENLICRQSAPAAASKAADVLGVLIAVPCMAWTGHFFAAHLGEPRFWAAAVLLHAWLAGVAACAVFRLVRRGEAIERISRLQFQALLVSGAAVFTAPLAIVAAKAWLGVDLYALTGTAGMLLLVAGSVAAAGVTAGILAAGARLRL